MTMTLMPIQPGAVQRRRLQQQQGMRDPRSFAGIFSRGRASSSVPQRPGTINTGVMNPAGNRQPLNNLKVAGKQTGLANAAQKPGMKKGVPFGFGYDEIYSDQIRNLQNQQSMLDRDKQIAQQRLLEQYGLSTEALQRQQQDALRQNDVSFANRGLLHSGINLAEQGEIGENAGRALEDITRSKDQSLQDLIAQYLDNKSGIETQMAEAEDQRAEREEERRRQEEMRRAEDFAAQKAAQEQQALNERMQNRYRRELGNLQPSPDGRGKLTRNLQGLQGIAGPDNKFSPEEALQLLQRLEGRTGYDYGFGEQKRLTDKLVGGDIGVSGVLGRTRSRKARQQMFGRNKRFNKDLSESERNKFERRMAKRRKKFAKTPDGKPKINPNSPRAKEMIKRRRDRRMRNKRVAF